MTKFIPSESLQKCYEDYYILLEDSLLGKKFDIIKCIQPMLSWTTIVKANGEVHSFAANMKYGIEKGWFIPFSHSAYAKLHVKTALKAADREAEYVFSAEILKAYPENLIQ